MVIPDFSGQSTTAITTVNAPSVVKIKPRSVEAIQLGDLTRFAKYVSHNGAGIQINILMSNILILPISISINGYLQAILDFLAIYC